MSHFAKVENNVVTRVIVAEPDFFDTFVDTSPGDWMETSYNGTIRKNYAGVGYTYDRVRDAFIPPKPFESWVLNEDTCRWDAPTPMPDDGQMYTWNEDAQAWDVNAS
jgi:hypothetical protein